MRKIHRFFNPETALQALKITRDSEAEKTTLTEAKAETLSKTGWEWSSKKT